MLNVISVQKFGYVLSTKALNTKNVSTKFGCVLSTNMLRMFWVCFKHNNVKNVYETFDVFEAQTH
jgi:hypothetical protein